MLLIRKSPLLSLENNVGTKKWAGLYMRVLANNWAQKTKALHVSNKNVKQLL